MKAKKFSYAQPGSISHGTMRNEDLIPAFCWELRNLGHRDRRLTEIERRSNVNESNPYWQSERASWDLESLFDMLQDHCLPYLYFGSHPGDGSDYGFWASEFLTEDFDGAVVFDLSELPDDYWGHAILVNDHGNITLFNVIPRKNRGWTAVEVWSFV